MELEEKLAKINPNDYGDGSKQEIIGFKEQVPRLHAQIDWQNHPFTKEVVKAYRERIMAIKNVLSENPSLNDVQRAGLFGEKRALEIIISSFMEDAGSQLESIEQIIDEEFK